MKRERGKKEVPRTTNRKASSGPHSPVSVGAAARTARSSIPPTATPQALTARDMLVPLTRFHTI